jgi:hypothetical protein
MENLSGAPKIFLLKIIYNPQHPTHLLFILIKSSIMKGIVLPNMCLIFSSIYTGGFLATVFDFWDWRVPPQDAPVPCPQLVYI